MHENRWNDFESTDFSLPTVFKQIFNSFPHFFNTFQHFLAFPLFDFQHFSTVFQQFSTIFPQSFNSLSTRTCWLVCSGLQVHQPSSNLPGTKTLKTWNIYGTKSRLYGAKNEGWDRGTAHSSCHKNEWKWPQIFVLVTKKNHSSTLDSTIPIRKPCQNPFVLPTIEPALITAKLCFLFIFVFSNNILLPPSQWRWRFASMPISTVILSVT